MKAAAISWIVAFVLSVLIGVAAAEIGLARMAPSFLRDAGFAIGDDILREAVAHGPARGVPRLVIVDVDQESRDKLDELVESPYDRIVLRRDRLADLITTIRLAKPAPNAIVVVDIDVSVPAGQTTDELALRNDAFRKALRAWREDAWAPLLLLNRGRDCSAPLVDDPRMASGPAPIRALAATAYDDLVWPTAAAGKISWTCPLAAQDQDGIWRQAFAFSCTTIAGRDAPLPSPALFAEISGSAEQRVRYVEREMSAGSEACNGLASPAVIRQIIPRYQWSNPATYKRLSATPGLFGKPMPELAGQDGFIVVAQNHATASDVFSVTLEPASPGFVLRANQLVSAAMGPAAPQRIWMYGLIALAAAVSTLIFVGGHTLRRWLSGRLAGWRRALARAALHPTVVQLAILFSFTILGGWLVNLLQDAVDWPTFAVSLCALTLGLSIADFIFDVRD